MKRRMVAEQTTETNVRRGGYIPINVPDSLKEYADELHAERGTAYIPIDGSAGSAGGEYSFFSSGYQLDGRAARRCIFHREVVREGCPVGQGSATEGR